MDKTLKYIFLLGLLCCASFGQILAPIMQKHPSAAPSFPTTSVLDTFTRANEDPLSDGGKWTCPYLLPGNLQVISNQAAKVSSDGACFWNVTTFGPETEAFVTVPVLPAGAGEFVILMARQNTGSSNGYDVTWIQGSGWEIDRDDAGVPTSLGTNAGTISAGDSIGMLIKGSTITAFRKTGGVWSSVFSATDSTYSAAGNIGVGTTDTSARLTNFGGGTGTE